MQYMTSMILVATVTVARPRVHPRLTGGGGPGPDRDGDGDPTDQDRDSSSEPGGKAKCLRLFLFVKDTVLSAQSSIFPLM